MKVKLHGMCEKMRQLEKTIAAGPNDIMTAEDIEAARQELLGLQELALESPDSLEKKLRAIERVFANTRRPSGRFPVPTSGWWSRLPRNTATAV